MGMTKQHGHGFTIVELLIVIVVIGIIAAIVTLTFNGVQERARLTVARTEINSFDKSVQVFRVDFDRNPSQLNDFSTVLRDSGMYDSTRTQDKSYAICANASGYAIVAWAPLVGTYKNGDTLYLVSKGSGQSLYTLTNSSLESNNQLDKICDQVYGDSTFDVWTYDVP